MKQKIFLFLSVIIFLSITGCNKYPNKTQNINNNNNVEESVTSQTQNTNNNNIEEPITLQSDNDYFIISGIDFSECTYENGYFKGYVYYNSHTTEKYVTTYNNYFYRKLYFDIIDITDETVGSDVTFDNYVYNREYSLQDDFYVLVRSKNPIKEVRLKKIELFVN